jgi:hypothetical protein
MALVAPNPITPVPYKTPILANKTDVIDQLIWMRWLTDIVRVLNGLSTYVRVSTGVTVANLPGSPVVGQLAQVTDSTTTTWGATIAGTGGNVVLAWFNGVHWTVVGK